MLNSPPLHHHHRLLLPPLFVDTQLTYVIVVMADGGHGGAEYPCCFCVDGVVVASSSRLPLSCFGGVECSPFPPKPPDTGKQMTMSTCVILTTPSSRHCHCQRRLHCTTTTEVLPLPSPRAHRVPLPPPPKIKTAIRWWQQPPAPFCRNDIP